jgi:hypothetical protein
VAGRNPLSRHAVRRVLAVPRSGVRILSHFLHTAIVELSKECRSPKTYSLRNSSTTLSQSGWRMAPHKG